jgi:hypothetical protein
VDAQARRNLVVPAVPSGSRTGSESVVPTLKGGTTHGTTESATSIRTLSGTAEPRSRQGNGSMNPQCGGRWRQLKAERDDLPLFEEAQRVD